MSLEIFLSFFLGSGVLTHFALVATAAFTYFRIYRELASLSLLPTLIRGKFVVLSILIQLVFYSTWCTTTLPFTFFRFTHSE
jgi:hypothetical protein